MAMEKPMNLKKKKKSKKERKMGIVPHLSLNAVFIILEKENLHIEKN